VVEPQTGVIYTRRPLDRETLSHYTIRVRAQSDVISAGEPPSDVTVVFIEVLDVNDHAPLVTSHSEVHLQLKSVITGKVFYR